jgi:hypothetical protein
MEAYYNGMHEEQGINDTQKERGQPRDFCTAYQRTKEAYINSMHQRAATQQENA